MQGKLLQPMETSASEEPRMLEQMGKVTDDED